MKLAHFICFFGVGLFLIFTGAPTYATDFSMSCDAQSCEPDSIARFFDENTLWYPSYGKSNTVTIQNTSETSQYIGHRAFNIRTSPTADLSRALDLTIVRKSVNKVVWKSTLREFYDSSESVLAVLGSGKTDSFEYTIVMNPAAGNEYQGATTQFDLLFGFFVPTVTPTPTPTPTPTMTPSPTPKKGKPSPTVTPIPSPTPAYSPTPTPTKKKNNPKDTQQVISPTEAPTVIPTAQPAVLGARDAAPATIIPSIEVPEVANDSWIDTIIQVSEELFLTWYQVIMQFLEGMVQTT